MRLDISPLDWPCLSQPKASTDYLAWLEGVCAVVESELAAPATTATAAPMAISALVLRPATVPPTAAPVAPAAGAAAAGTGAPPTGAVV